MARKHRVTAGPHMPKPCRHRLCNGLVLARHVLGPFAAVHCLCTKSFLRYRFECFTQKQQRPARTCVQWSWDGFCWRRQGAYSPPTLRRSAAETQGAMFVMAAAICLQLRSENLICVEERAHSFCVRAKIDTRSETSSLPSSRPTAMRKTRLRNSRAAFDSIST